MKNNKSAWVKTLKVGDEVAYMSRDITGVKWVTSVVEKITPSGRLNLPYGYVINPDGTFRGDVHREIHPVTPEVKEAIAKRELVSKLNRQFNAVDLANATLEQLDEAHELLMEFPVKGRS